MKSIVGLLLTVIVAIEGAAIEGQQVSKYVAVPTQLFESAWKKHDELSALQKDINKQLTDLRTAKSAVLKTSTNDSLTRIEKNANDIIALDEPIRDAVFALESSLCVNNLRVLLNGITEFSGFGSANCISSYDLSVQKALNAATNAIRQFDKSFGDVQQIVVRAFIGFNVFLEPKEIEERFQNRFNTVSAEWKAARPDVVGFAGRLAAQIEGLNSGLGSCFEKIQSELPSSYGRVKSSIGTCNVFDTTVDPFAPITGETTTTARATTQTEAQTDESTILTEAATEDPTNETTSKPVQ